MFFGIEKLQAVLFGKQECAVLSYTIYDIMGVVTHLSLLLLNVKLQSIVLI